ncbi:MAG: hypothetical protein QNK37_34185 [Acidobacteriota bacterium]|nr:hypothetical protein [Acidobacteriota bacterium]
MNLSQSEVQSLLDNELKSISDASLIHQIRPLLITPHRVEREWDYGEERRTYPCWTVMAHHMTNSGIAYCNQGFGPSHPWGLVFLSGDMMGMGLKAAWFDSFEIAFKESMAYGW